MVISRTTVTEIYEAAHYKLADSIVNGKSGIERKEIIKMSCTAMIELYNRLH